MTAIVVSRRVADIFTTSLPWSFATATHARLDASSLPANSPKGEKLAAAGAAAQFHYRKADVADRQLGVDMRRKAIRLSPGQQRPLEHSSEFSTLRTLKLSSHGRTG
jgi:hypothetical protein